VVDGIGFDEVLENCLDALEGGQGLAEVLARYPEHAEELKPLLEAAVWFGGQAAAVGPRPGFVAASRARLVQQVAAPHAATGGGLAMAWRGLGSSWRIALQLGVVFVMLACLVLGSSGIAYASQNALPGDALYPVKLGLEQVELLVTLDPQADLRLHLQFSQLRIAEMQRLLALGRYEDLAIATANYRHHIDQALALLELLAAQNPAQAQSLAQEVEVVLTAQALRLGVLANIAPEAARAELEAAQQAAQDGAQQAHAIGESTETPLPTDATGVGELPQATETPTPPPTATVASFAMSTDTPTPEPSLTPTPTQARTPTPTPTRTSTSAPVRTATPTGKPNTTATARASSTSAPTATRTPRPTSTRTGQPTPTRTSQPTPTRTGQPTPTQTVQPTPTRTGQPTPTRTTQPTSTATLPPATPTATDIPPTSTIAPPPTRTPKPTPTPRPTETAAPTPYPGPGIYPPPG
jgi:hypothetical protein